jgi:hypothetical protein
VWSGLLQAGMALLQQFSGGGPKAGDAAGGGPGALGALVRRDEQTGEPYVRLPVPPPEVLDQALQALGSLLRGLRR